MNQAFGAFLGAIAGAVVALTTSIITNIVSTRNERAKSEAAKHAAHVEALRGSVATVFSYFFAIQHAINWLTWIAKFDPSALDAESIKSYDNEVHDAMPKLLGAMATVASLNLNVYDDLQQLCERLYDLDRTVAVSLRAPGTVEATEAAHHELERSWEKARQLERVLPQQVAEFMASAETRAVR